MCRTLGSWPKWVEALKIFRRSLSFLEDLYSRSERSLEAAKPAARAEFNQRVRYTIAELQLPKGTVELYIWDRPGASVVAKEGERQRREAVRTKKAAQCMAHYAQMQRVLTDRPIQAPTSKKIAIFTLPNFQRASDGRSPE